jgi:aspartyl aminopeptidase
MAEEMKIEPEQIKGFDLCFSDHQKPIIFGLNDEFLSSPRLDNVFSFFSSLLAIADPNEF